MGSYCDRCNSICGSLKTSDLSQILQYDLCSDCHKSVYDIIVKNINNHKKYNKIGGYHNE